MRRDVSAGKAHLECGALLGRLEELSIWPHGLEAGDDPYRDAGGVSALARSPHLGRLRRLHLYLNDMGDRGLEAIVESGISRG
jgi:hypothetical protein